MKPEDRYDRYKSYKNIDEGHRTTIEETLTYISYNAWLKGLNDGILRGDAKAVVRITGLIEADRDESHAIDDIYDGVVFQTLSRVEFKEALIALIKGEK